MINESLVAQIRDFLTKGIITPREPNVPREPQRKPLITERNLNELSVVPREPIVPKETPRESKVIPKEHEIIPIVPKEPIVPMEPQRILNEPSVVARESKVIPRETPTVPKEPQSEIRSTTTMRELRPTIPVQIFAQSSLPIQSEAVPKRKSLGVSMVTKVWQTLYPETMKGTCLLCGVSQIELAEREGWEVSHLISHKNGGSQELDNLRPLCRRCNRSMSGKDFLTYCEQHYPSRLEEIKRAFRISEVKLPNEAKPSDDDDGIEV